MKGNARVIQALNEVLVGELTAVNQYFLAAKICRQKGYERLHEKLHREAIEEMRHAERLVERILLLQGLPNMQKLEKIQLAEDVPGQLRLDLETERKSVERLNEGIKLARDAGDNGSADLLEELLEAAEGHVRWLEAQTALLEQLGAAHYLAQQVRS
jgi:bacterioferritin